MWKWLVFATIAFMYSISTNQRIAELEAQQRSLKNSVVYWLPVSPPSSDCLSCRIASSERCL